MTKDLSHPPCKKGDSSLTEGHSASAESTLTWSDVSWLKSLTRLPLLVKGVMTGEDAKEAVNRGVSGIIVSNHGGRQLDSVPATIDVLSEVVSAVSLSSDSSIPVFVDGGFRTGDDVLKAIVLGARGVFVGRPILWGLAVKGEAGATSVLEIFRKELDVNLALMGYTNMAEVRSKKGLVIRKQNFYQRSFR